MQATNPFLSVINLIYYHLHNITLRIVGILIHLAEDSQWQTKWWHSFLHVATVMITNNQKEKKEKKRNLEKEKGNFQIIVTMLTNVGPVPHKELLLQT